MADLRLSEYEVSGCPVLGVAGEIDIATVPQLRAALGEVVKAAPNKLVLDLRQVTFMDCSGLGVLVGARRRMPDGGLLCIVCDRVTLVQIFDITGLRRAFPVFSTIGEAVAHERVWYMPVHRSPVVRDPVTLPSSHNGRSGRNEGGNT